MSGAFDKVVLKRLVQKLTNKGLHPKIVAVLASWLRQRRAMVVVGGMTSKEMALKDMVYQGTVTGPMLWNLFFEDARESINECLYTEAVYADDLNAYREFSANTSNADIETSLNGCQKELHSWGAANQVEFDAGKESQHILSLSEPSGTGFKLLGVGFDEQLTM